MDINNIFGTPPDQLLEPQNSDDLFSAKKIESEALANVIVKSLTVDTPSWSFINSHREERRKDMEEYKLALVKQMMKSGVDPTLFDIQLSNDSDRRLKVFFGKSFLILTSLFTSVSYLLIVLNSICNWGIPKYAITALIIETPIQFIGLLYIIARNLFPQKEPQDKKGKL